ncbi:MAG: hypothetical protein ACTSWN_04985 [Promethearchaeota archaeon]
MKEKKNILIYLVLLVPAPAFTCISLVILPFLDESISGMAGSIIDFLVIMILVLNVAFIVVPLLLLRFLRKDWIHWLHVHHYEELVSLVNWLIFLVPLIWLSIHMGVIYGSFEAGIGLFFTCVFSSFFLPALVVLIKNRCAVYPVIVNVICVFVFVILSIFNPLVVPLGIINTISIFVSLKSRRFKARRRELSVIVVPVVVGLIVSTPFIIFDNPEIFSTEITIPAEDDPPGSLLVDWTWADEYDNPSGINESILDALVYCNNLENINVSVTIALPEEFLNDFGAGEIQKLLDRNISVNIMLMLPKDPDYFYINDFTIEHYSEVTYPLFKQWVSLHNFTGRFTSIIIDLEPLIGNISRVFFSSYNPNVHGSAVSKLENLIESMKADFGVYGTLVIGATFGYFIDDFVDLDDSLFRFLGLATVPPTNWDAMGFMCYERGSSAYYSLYTLCKGINYYFGNLGIPYIISKQSFEEILTEFKIIRNFGFDYAGIWALQDFLDRQSKAGYNSTERLIDLHEALNVPGSVSFQRKDVESAYIHSGIMLADLLFWDFTFRSPGRLMGTSIV